LARLDDRPLRCRRLGPLHPLARGGGQPSRAREVRDRRAPPLPRRRLRPVAAALPAAARGVRRDRADVSRRVPRGEPVAERLLPRSAGGRARRPARPGRGRPRPCRRAAQGPPRVEPRPAARDPTGARDAVPWRPRGRPRAHRERAPQHRRPPAHRVPRAPAHAHERRGGQGLVHGRGAGGVHGRPGGAPRRTPARPGRRGVGAAGGRGALPLRARRPSRRRGRRRPLRGRGTPARARGGRPRRACVVRRDARRCPPHARHPPHGAGAGGSRARGHGATPWRACRLRRRRPPMRHSGWLPLLLLAACSRPVAPPPPDMVRTVAVLAPANRTGDPLLVAGTSFLEKYALKSDRVTVPDVLASEARVQLAHRGFTVLSADEVESATHGRAPGSPEAAAEIASHAKLAGLALYLDIRRWEPDAPTHPSFIVVGLTASLVDPASGRVVWTAERPTGPVATPGEVALGPAYVTAARKSMEELLAPLGPVRPPAS